MSRVVPSIPGRNDPCPCGSGQKFKRCCKPKKDMIEIFNPDKEADLSGEPEFAVRVKLVRNESKIALANGSAPACVVYRAHIMARHGQSADQIRQLTLDSSPVLEESPIEGGEPVENQPQDAAILELCNGVGKILADYVKKHREGK